MSNAQGSHRATRGSRHAAPGAAEPYETLQPPYGTHGPYEMRESCDVHGAYEPEALPYAPGEPGEAPAPAYETYTPVYEARTLVSGAYGSHAPTQTMYTAYTPTVASLPRQGPAPEDEGAPAEAGSRGGTRRGSRRRRTGDRPDALRRLIPQALVVAFLAGGTSAFVASDKAVRLTVDGVPRTMHTFADDVQELLEDEGLDVSTHDIVAPAPGSALISGDDIVVRYGRPVMLTLDGQRRQVWTTARTVEEALRQLGVRAEGAYLSVSRSLAISRGGLALDVRTERTVTFMADGRERTIRTNAATVREALGEAGIALRGQDTTSVPPGTFPRDGQTVTVMRITGTREVREEPIFFATEKTGDPELFAGTEVVVRQGRPGALRVTYGLRTVNGVKEKPRKIAQEIVREPVTQQVKVGTKPLPRSVQGANGLNWSALARCESGGRPDAVDPSGNYGGLYQFDTGTWHALGGTGRPQDASAAEQTFRAKKLFVKRGASPWPHCGRRLYR